ncbi:hypothetical protein [Salinactinospora qingdaonensis]|uniref:Uncharacterized protein n=1 Tax=Salinactinospora qingdaonensis TaxID=702744 RepID=A0ABP7FBU0_9ACTN
MRPTTIPGPYLPAGTPAPRRLWAGTVTAPRPRRPGGGHAGTIGLAYRADSTGHGFSTPLWLKEAPAPTQ